MAPRPALLHAMDRLLDRLPPPGKTLLASTASRGWRGVHGAILEGCFDAPFNYSAPFPIVKFILQGVATLEWKRGPRYSRLNVQPGEFLVTPPGDDRALRSSGSNVGFTLLVDPIRLRTLADQEWEVDGARIEVREAYHRSAEFWTIGQRLAAQLQAPIPGSRLFAETLATQLSILLLQQYSTLSRPSHGAPVEALTDLRLHRVIDYLQSSFGEEISLDGLARVAGLSPNYFLHAFRESTGRTPHRYLTEIRIERACEFLRDPNRSIVEISLAVGFSSQSHLTTVFRRFMKTTPAAYREEVLGLRGGGDRKIPKPRKVIS